MVGGGEGWAQWPCQTYSGRRQIMSSCRWVGDKHRVLPFLAKTDSVKNRTTSNPARKTLGPLRTHNAPVFVSRIKALISAQRAPSSQRFGRAIHQTESCLSVQGGLLNWCNAACCSFIRKYNRGIKKTIHKYLKQSLKWCGV